MTGNKAADILCALPGADQASVEPVLSSARLIRYGLLKTSKNRILFIPSQNSEAGMMESTLSNLLSLQIEKLRSGQVNLLNYVE